MMKNEFLTRLKELLSNLPQEEREEAIRYYEDYFEDAGPLEESRVLKELISPEDVAEKIRAGCGGRVSEKETFFARDTLDEQKSVQTQDSTGKMEEAFMQDGSGAEQFSWDQEDARTQEERMRMDETYTQDYEETEKYAQNDRRFRAGGEESYPRGATVRTKNYFSPVIFILALIIGLPILCPILLGFICMMGGLFLLFGIGGIGLIAGGVALVGNAFTFMSVGSGLACLVSGGGLILTAFGILFIVLAINCAFRAIPALFRGIRNIVLALRGCRA